MLLRLIALAAALTSTTASVPPPPTVIASYVHDGHFDPGDYSWMRGAFADASPADKEQWRALVTWRAQCRDAGRRATVAALAQRGVVTTLSDLGMGDGLCGEVGYAMPHADEGENWAAFRAAVARARQVAAAIVWSAALAQRNVVPYRLDEGAMLNARTMTDQVLRGSLAWGNGDVPGAPVLDPAARGIAEGIIWRAIGERDHANTAALKKLVAEKGWPTIPMVGESGSSSAWLLVQHADDDPVFQYDMLRLMEPLAAKGAVSKEDYAMLYDRVMLKLTGKQRYGAMATCIGGRWAPMPLEDATAVDRWRREAGMTTLAQNLARIAASSGPCPPDVIPPSPAKR